MNALRERFELLQHAAVREEVSRQVCEFCGEPAETGFEVTGTAGQTCLPNPDVRTLDPRAVRWTFSCLSCNRAVEEGLRATMARLQSEGGAA